MNFTGKMSAGMTSFKRSMKNGVDNCKLDGRISEQEKIIKELKKEIGNLAFIRLEEGDVMCPQIMERYEAILEAREIIRSVEEERVVVKSVCPVCGAKTYVGMKYCGECGAQIVEEMVEA